MQFPGNHGGVNWCGTSFNPQLGYLFVNTNELGQLSGVKDHDPKTGRAGGRRAGQSRRSGGPVRGCAGRRTFQRAGQRFAAAAVPAAALGTIDRGQREHRRVRVAGAARGHRQPAGGQAEDRTSRKRRHDRDRGRAGVRGARRTTAASARSMRRTARSCGPSSWAARRRRRR